MTLRVQTLDSDLLTLVCKLKPRFLLAYPAATPQARALPVGTKT